MPVGKGAQPEPTLIGRNLARLLEKHGIGHRELAQRTGGVVSHADVSRIKSGETPDPSGNKLRAIAQVLGEDTDTFWADPEHPERREPGLDAFLSSELAKEAKVTEEEIILLAGSRPPPGRKLTVSGWWHILQAIRDSAQEPQ